jgi:ubiquinone/menaquinone biosynthesis C-methylase UbiE
VLTLNIDHRIDFFERIAPYYDTLLGLVTIGLYGKFLRKAIEVLAPQKGEKILDLCSGTGKAASWMAHEVGQEGEVVGLDVARHMVEMAKKRYGDTGNVIFLQKDVTQPWDYQNHFDGIFISLALHELPGGERRGVLEQCHVALKKRGRMVIADFNPQISGRGKIIALTFFKLFEKENLNFFSFKPNDILKKVGFKRTRTFPVLASLFQITIARKT